MKLGLYNGANIIFLHSEQFLANDDSMKEKISAKTKYPLFDGCFSILLFRSVEASSITCKQICKKKY
jgi:hypothetical protein